MLFVCYLKFCFFFNTTYKVTTVLIFKRLQTPFHYFITQIIIEILMSTLQLIKLSYFTVIFKTGEHLYFVQERLKWQAAREYCRVNHKGDLLMTHVDNEHQRQSVKIILRFNKFSKGF